METKQVRVVMLAENHQSGWRAGQLCKCVMESDKVPEDHVGNLKISGHQYDGFTHFWQAQNIYFISDDQIKKDDWFIDNHKRICMCKSVENPDTRMDGHKKVVASTDPALKLPLVPTEWIRNKYVPSGGKINKVKLQIDEEFSDWYERMELKSYPNYKLKFTPNSEVVIVDEQPIRIEGGELVMKNGIASNTPLRVVLPDEDKELEAAAKTSYENNKPTSAFGIFSIREQNNRQLYKEGYINGWNAREKQSEDDAIAFVQWKDENCTQSNVGVKGANWFMNNHVGAMVHYDNKQLYQIWRQTQNK